ncbi:hypothetical protein BH09BAC1_BH09BAC1_27090 [soil metagenome]
MELLCNNCGASIRADEVNIATDMAKCSACNSLMRASELKEKVSITDLLVQPQSSKLQIEQGRNNSIVLTAPANGVNVESIGLTVFSIIWLGFITVWTLFAFMGSAFFALFSIPFWLVGIFIAKVAIDKIFETQIVTFNSYEVTIESKRPLFSKQITISKEEITDVTMSDLLSGGPLDGLVQRSAYTKRGGKAIDYPVIVTKTKTHFFFQNLPEKDQLWAVRLLKNVLSP